LEGMRRAVARAASLAIMLEPTGWGVGGNVSRMRDHPDKALQDYIVLGYEFGERIVDEAGAEDGSGSRFLYLIREQMRRFGTNLAFGEIFLLYLNAYGALRMRSLDPDAAAEGAVSLLETMEPRNYFEAISASMPGFIGRFSSSLIPSLTPPISSGSAEGRLGSILRLNPHDPVSCEATRGFPVSRKLYRELIETLSCRIPRSRDIDSIFRRICGFYVDYLVYRRDGLEAAEKAQQECCLGKAEKSLGSISDVAALVLFYYFLRCSGGER